MKQERIHVETRVQKRRIGFLKGKIKVPDDFNTAYAAEIEEMFCGGELFPSEKPPSDLRNRRCTELKAKS